MLARAAKTENPFLVRCSETARENLRGKRAQRFLGLLGWTSVTSDWFMISLNTIDQSQLTLDYPNDHRNRYTPKQDPHFQLKLLRLTEEARRARYISRILKLLEHFYFLHFTFLIRASNVVKTWRLILQVVLVLLRWWISIEGWQGHLVC